MASMYRLSDHRTPYLNLCGLNITAIGVEPSHYDAVQEYWTQQAERNERNWVSESYL